MLTLMLHSLQPFHGAVNFILAQLYIGVNKAETLNELLGTCSGKKQPLTPYGK
jgi:hypothetical protein